MWSLPLRSLCTESESIVVGLSRLSVTANGLARGFCRTTGREAHQMQYVSMVGKRHRD